MYKKNQNIIESQKEICLSLMEVYGAHNYVFDKCSQIKHEILESIKKARKEVRHCDMIFLDDLGHRNLIQTFCKVIYYNCEINTIQFFYDIDKYA